MISVVCGVMVGFLVGCIFEERVNSKSVVRKFNRKFSKKIMFGKDYLLALRKMSSYSNDVKFVNELDRIFVVRKWLDKKAKFTIVEYNHYTVSADFDSFEDFVVSSNEFEEKSDE